MVFTNVCILQWFVTGIWEFTCGVVKQQHCPNNYKYGSESCLLAYCSNWGAGG